jgi:hypothetical protein
LGFLEYHFFPMIPSVYPGSTCKSTRETNGKIIIINDDSTFQQNMERPLLQAFLLSEMPCEFLLSRIIYAMHSILRIGAVHGYISNYEQVCALLDWSCPSQTTEYLFFLQRSFFPFGTTWK